ncbi:MAG: sulfurtransferase TusA family protein [Nitrospirae bacterium]|nr:sulfurtransferase TusA family protein [Nitrospirota bacterium]
MSECKIDRVIDVKGITCPKSLIIATNTLKSMAKGQCLKIICGDGSIKHNLPAVCKKSGFTILETKEEDGVVSFIIQR